MNNGKSTKKNLLIIDDDFICLRYLKDLITKNYCCDVEIVDSPIDALDILHRKSFEWEPEWYDLILMDIQMPTLQGDKLSQVINDMISRKEMKAIPIVVITSNLTNEQQRNLLQLGITDILHKPITKEMIDMVFDKYLIHK